MRGDLDPETAAIAGFFVASGLLPSDVTPEATVIRKLLLVSLSIGCISLLFGAEASAHKQCAMRRNTSYRQTYRSNDQNRWQYQRQVSTSTTTAKPQQQSDVPPGLRLSARQKD
jgi:hypothetical protein